MINTKTYCSIHPQTETPPQPRVLNSYMNNKKVTDNPYIILCFLFCQIYSGRTSSTVTESLNLWTTNTLNSEVIPKQSHYIVPICHNQRILPFTNCITAVSPLTASFSNDSTMHSSLHTQKEIMPNFQGHNSCKIWGTKNENSRQKKVKIQKTKPRTEATDSVFALVF